MATMSRAHREIFHLVELFQRQVDDLPASGPEPADIRDLRRTLYGLHAILRLHFDTRGRALRLDGAGLGQDTG